MNMIKEMDGVYIAPNASVMGSVKIGRDSSVWYGCVIRADMNSITIGSRTNIQDNTVIHVDEGKPVVIGDNVTVGHSCLIHGCTIGNNTLIGMGSIILNGAKIGNNCLIGAGSLITGKTVIEDGSLVMGSPAKVKKELNEEQIAELSESAEEYVELAERHFG